MNIFLICPVRNITDEYRASIETQVKNLESQGHIVYYPTRDTDQVDPTGYHICTDNKKAIEKADIVYIIWDGKSTGSLFDLGMAFAMNKKIRTVTGFFPARSEIKSFQNMVYKWETKTKVE